MLPLVQVDLGRELYEEKCEEISRELQQAQIDTLGTAPDDLFQVYYPHQRGEFRFDVRYGGVDRQSLIVVRITLVHKHSVAVKNRLYASILDRLAALGIRPDEVLIAIVENGFEDWCAGRLDGRAVPQPKN